MLRLLAMNAISSAGLERLPRERYLVGDDGAEPDAILVRSRDPHACPIPPAVKAFDGTGTGGAP